MALRQLTVKSPSIRALNACLTLILLSCANAENEIESEAVAEGKKANPTAAAPKDSANIKKSQEVKPEADGTQKDTEPQAEEPAGGLGQLVGSLLDSVIKENAAPQIEKIPNQQVSAGRSVDNIPVKIFDDEGALKCSSALTIDSSNSDLIPAARVSVGGDVDDCTLTLAPLPGKVGVAEIGVKVSDGEKSQQVSFSLTVSGWGLDARFQAVNAHDRAAFGNVVGLGENLLVVGALQDDSSSQTITNGPAAPGTMTRDQSGAVLIYRQKGANWEQESFIKAANASDVGWFGASVSVSDDTVAVGAPLDDSSQQTITPRAALDSGARDSGAVHIFRYSNSLWYREAYVKASNAAANDWFGSSVSLSGDYLAVSAHQEDSNQTTVTNGVTAASTNRELLSSGAVYVYKRSGSGWSQDAYIKAGNAGSEDMFGEKISLHMDTLAIAATGEDSSQKTITQTPSADNELSNSGAVYVFRRKETSGWELEQFIKAQNSGSNDYFGSSLALFKNRLAVGAPNEDSDFNAVRSSLLDNESNDLLNSSGAVYLFKREENESGAVWSLESFFKAPNAKAQMEFGISLGLSDDRLIVGAAKEDSNQSYISQISEHAESLKIDAASSPMTGAGAVYVFAFDKEKNLWKPEAYIKSPHPSNSANFGKSVDIFGSTLAVGAPYERMRTAAGSNANVQSGGAYVFRYVSHLSETPSASTTPVPTATALPTSTPGVSMTATPPPSPSPSPSPTPSAQDIALANYNNKFQGVIATNCAQGSMCHSSTNTYNNKVYDTFALVKSNAQSIKSRLITTNSTQKMPRFSPSTFSETNRKDLVDFIDAVIALP